MAENTHVIDRMRELVLWDDMWTFCIAGGGKCSGCPYKRGMLCDRTSTENIMHACAAVFKEFLEEVTA